MDFVNAAGIVTVHDDVLYAKIYNEKGVALTDHGLAAGSKWKTDVAFVLDGKWYHRVAVDQFLCEDDVDFNFA